MAVDVTLPVEEVLADAVNVERATETRDSIVNDNVPDYSHSLVPRIIVYLVSNWLSWKHSFREKSKNGKQVLISFLTLERNSRGIGDLNLININIVVQRLHKQQRIVWIKSIDNLTKLQIKIFGP